MLADALVISILRLFVLIQITFPDMAAPVFLQHCIPNPLASHLKLSACECLKCASRARQKSSRVQSSVCDCHRRTSQSLYLSFSFHVSHNFLTQTQQWRTLRMSNKRERERERDHAWPRRRRRLCGAHGSLSIILYGHIKVIYGPPCATHTHINK